MCRNIVEGVVASGTRKLGLEDERLFLVAVQSCKPGGSPGVPAVVTQMFQAC